ncbi:hypothetical protein Tco_0910539 [Tanacetum coccineum]|uniref:Uncharacterized protein n=1 Tax=Tanacetum coccineum TaxID=301880 RepID=A0ABQ5D0B3_9ASTR
MDEWRRLDVFGAYSSESSFVTSLSFSTTGGGIGGPSYETPLRVVIALVSFLGFGMVLLGKELELEGPDNSLPEFETFSDHTKETSSGNTTTHAENYLPEYDSFLFEIEPDQGELTSVVMEDILGEPRVHVPNVLPTYPTLILDLDFILSDDSLGSNLEVSFPYETRNKIFDLGIFFKVQSKRFLSRDTFSISFIHNPLCPVIETLLPFSSKNEHKVFNPGILLSNLLSHLGKITFDFFKSPMMIFGGDIPFLDVLFLHFYPP